MSATIVIRFGIAVALVLGAMLAQAQGLPNDKFDSVLPENIKWQPFAAFPEGVQLAVVVGTPSKPGPYVVRVKTPAGGKLMPHRHPEDRIYTVISGIFYIGLGETFDESKLKAYPPGSVVVLPGGVAHFHWAKSGEYVTQITANGPLGLDYVNHADDPRSKPGGGEHATAPAPRPKPD
jgi:quercetin dioxygenase-like cupin family protein